MSRIWAHPLYAEDQPLSRTILWTHVLTRAVTLGSIVGTGTGLSLISLRHFNVLKPRSPPLFLTTTILRSAGVGSIVALGILSVGLPLRMWGREQIEWQDRSWRLLENKGQVECDDWTYTGMAVGAVAAVTKGKGLGWKGKIGAVGIGSVVGMVGYMGWRHGVKRGKFKDTF